MVATKLSLAEYLSLDNSPDTRCEFVDGEIIEMAPEGKPHAHLSSTAADYICEKLAGKARVREAKPMLGSSGLNVCSG